MAEKIEANIFDDSEIFYREGIANLPDVNILPYACYIDDKTILTENGELLQTIKIPSFLESKEELDSYSLRDNLNEIFLKNNSDKNINFYFQTIRKKVNLVPTNDKYKDTFVNNIIDKWNIFNNWENQYANEIYITFIITPYNTKVGKVFDFIKAIYSPILKGSKMKELKKMLESLNSCSSSFIDNLKQYEARYLTIKKEDNIYYAEHLQLFNLIINGEDRKIKLPINHLSESLIDRKFIYENNYIRAYNSINEIYSAILSIKYCNKLLLSQLDKIIQLNQELVITQTVTYVESKDINDMCRDYLEKLSVNEDNEMMAMSGYADILQNTSTNPYSTVASQLLIQVRSDDKDDLEAKIKDIVKIIRQIGLVVVREEMFMPTLFWSQLPANFNFIKRIQAIPEQNVCSFTSLYSFPIGKIFNNYWGDCALVLKSALNTPYFLPLHIEKNGNTFIMGPKSLKKTKYLNFLLLSSLKQVQKIYYIDNTNRSEVFVNSIGGNYYFITSRNAKFRLQFNPFSLPKNDDSMNFLIQWLKYIVFQHEDGMVKMDDSNTGLEQEWEKFENNFKTSFNSIKNFNDVFSIISSANLSRISTALKQWVDNDDYGMLFGDVDVFDKNQNDILGLNISNIINNEVLRTAIADYILYKISILVDKQQRTILAIDESWILFDSKHIADKLVNILQTLYSKNVAVIITTSGSESFESSNITFSVKNLFATHIVLPNMKMTVYQKKVFAIADEEIKVISVMQEEKGTFLLKNGKNILISSFDFSFLDKEELAILIGGNVITNIMKKAKTLINSEDVNVWMPLFLPMIKEYNKKKHEQKIREQEKRQVQWEEAKQGGSNNTILNS